MKKEGKLLVMPSATHIPADYAVSFHVRNLINTFGEQKVRQCLEELFGFQSSDASSDSDEEWVSIEKAGNIIGF